MSPIRQTAGACMIEVYTDGYPLFPQITIKQPNSDVVVSRGSVADLHDLRYCIDRVLAQIPTPKGDRQ